MSKESLDLKHSNDTSCTQASSTSRHEFLTVCNIWQAKRPSFGWHAREQGRLEWSRLCQEDGTLNEITLQMLRQEQKSLTQALTDRGIYQLSDIHELYHKVNSNEKMPIPAWLQIEPLREHCLIFHMSTTKNQPCEYRASVFGDSSYCSTQGLLTITREGLYKFIYSGPKGCTKLIRYLSTTNEVLHTFSHFAQCTSAFQMFVQHGETFKIHPYDGFADTEIRDFQVKRIDK